MTAPPRYLSTEELVAKAQRRAALTIDYEPPEGGQLTAQDCQDADAAVVAEWLERGRLTHLGMAPRRRR